MALKHLNKLSRDEELYQEALSAEFNEVAYQLYRKGLMEEGMQKGMQKGRQEGLQEGLQKGMQKRDKEVILNMLKEKADISFISKVTGLSEDEIIKLKK